ncbi:hypothetical protein MON38_09060 [Hymenobacter sp. DH14]|uniref:Outer membrane protein beta-barrel domain-containing protein n=1 Tax=Hymenobacter cyanobacteriorum TaxID=2926463 RepID=A0A9X2AF78_9BACT|nr:hypothetical protein [Hymenobacter cyanobacteriorum]MCI1187567.1 hypothetical protein [Hymenobacter cyanobacteriorum]
MQKLLPFLLFLLAGLQAAAQEMSAKPVAYREYKAALGLLGNPKVLGVQAEGRFGQRFGGRLVATQVFDSHRQNEFSAGGIGLLTYYIPLKNPRLEPVVGIGGVYSLYHWDLGPNANKGTLTDFNVGGGAGLNLRFSNDFRAGINVLVANGFVADYQDGDMRVARRKLLVMPALTFDILL